MSISVSDLKKWIEEWEGPSLEFKVKVTEDCGKSISAFTNTYGGRIVFGVDAKNKALKGLENPDEESQRIRQILDQCKPNPKPEQEFIRHEGKTFIVLVIEPFPYSQNPCFFNKHCFIRQGSTNLELSGEELIDFLKKRTILNFEELKSQNSKFSDLDIRKIEKLLKARKIDLTNFNEEEVKKILAGLHLAASYDDNFQLKNAAMLFLAKEPQRFFSNLETRVVSYDSNEASLASIKLDKRIQGTIPELVLDTYSLVSENIGKSYVLKGAIRKEILEVPADALREAITNALGHRDYFDQNLVLIEIFSNRVQITSPGGLLYGQDLSNLDKTPKHRNPITYQLLQYLGLGEGLGLGIKLIKSSCQEAKLPEPKFLTIGNSFQVTLYNKKAKKSETENPRLTKLIKMLKTFSSIKAADYAKEMKITLPTAVSDLNYLIAQGAVEKIGKYKGASYKLK